MIKKGLGKGLGALINTDDLESSQGVSELKINEIEPNVNQPRKNFNDEKLVQLSESIKQHGIVQPIIVKKEGDIYRIVAGERRWRAARLAGLVTVPVIIRELSNRQLMEIALIENLQREDLNPIEEAEAYERLMKDFDLTQEEISKTVGKSRSAIANSIRLLGLNEKIRNYIISGDISSGHARALITIEDDNIKEKAIDIIIEKSLNVRDTEKLVKQMMNKKVKRKVPEANEQIIEIEERFKNILGTKVKLITNNKKGKIMIEYYSNEDLQRIMDIFSNIGKN